MNKKIAVLIDGDNISFKNLKKILKKLSDLGYKLVIRRMYADWRRQKKEFEKAIIDYGLRPVQTYFAEGKNITDISLIIDAMDIMYTKDVDGFAIISSDRDFIPLVSRLKEQNLFLIGAGEKGKISNILPNFYDIFIELSEEKIAPKSNSIPKKHKSEKQLIRRIEEIFEQQNKNKKLQMGIIGNKLKEGNELEKYKEHKQIKTSHKLTTILQDLDFSTLKLSNDNRFFIKKN